MSGTSACEVNDNNVIELPVDKNGISEPKLVTETNESIKVPFIDRELSWLQFNDRVFEQTSRNDIPNRDKLNFIGIAASNLDEFVSVRFSGVYNAKENDEDGCSDENYHTILSQICQQKVKMLDAMSNYRGNIGSIIEKFVQPYGVDDSVIKSKKFNKYFAEQIFPILTPIAVGSNKEVPKFNDDDVNFFIKLHDPNNKDKSIFCFMQIPHQVHRVVKMGSKYYFIEDFVEAHLDEIFNKKIVDSYVLFKVTKEYDTEVEHNPNVSIIDRVNTVLKTREENNIIFIDCITYGDEEESRSLTRYLSKLLKVPKRHIVISRAERNNRLALQFLKSNPFKKAVIEDGDGVTENTWKSSFEPKLPYELLGESSIFDYLDDDDLIVHHPYESYDVVVGFLQEAANDPKVISIKQTLYRVSSEKSPIIKALCDAAKNGKKVTVMLELLARFDEKQNINLINKLNESGCTIVYSLEGLKTHCKMCLVTKATKKGIVLYSHMGTGNYNEKTANIYTDISYFTSKHVIGHDLNSIFNMITGFSKPDNLKMIRYSPDTLRLTIEDEIDKCAENSSEENPATINFKINSLSDKGMVDKIYNTAKTHPHLTFNIICRGICSLTPLPNIKIKSVIGRFLEHSRIYIFNYAGKNRVFISSADLLTRNLDKRIETLIPINDRKCKKKVLNIFEELDKDTANTWVMNNDLQYNEIDSSKYINTQNSFIME